MELLDMEDLCRVFRTLEEVSYFDRQKAEWILEPLAVRQDRGWDMIMGMDCYAFKKGVSRESTNWAGWEFLAELLTELECPMDEFKYTNDEDIVSEVTAKEYGEAIRNAVREGRIFTLTISDKSSVGNFIRIPAVVKDSTVNASADQMENSQVRYITAVELKNPTIDAIVNVLQGGSREVTDDKRFIMIHTAIPDPATEKGSLIDLVTGQKLKEINAERKEWLLKWADFFIDSGGFTQW